MASISLPPGGDPRPTRMPPWCKQLLLSLAALAKQSVAYRKSLETCVITLLQYTLHLIAYKTTATVQPVGSVHIHMCMYMQCISWFNIVKINLITLKFTALRGSTHLSCQCQISAESRKWWPTPRRYSHVSSCPPPSSYLSRNETNWPKLAKRLKSLGCNFSSLLVGWVILGDEWRLQSWEIKSAYLQTLLIGCHCKTPPPSHPKLIAIPYWVMSILIRLAQKGIFELSIVSNWGNDSFDK